jgi:hypothetical protein
MMTTIIKVTMPTAGRPTPIRYVSSTPFSEFIRTASSEDKKKVYSKVLKRASESQNEVLARVSKKRATR